MRGRGVSFALLIPASRTKNLAYEFVKNETISQKPSHESLGLLVELIKEKNSFRSGTTAGGTAAALWRMTYDLQCRYGFSGIFW